MRHGAPLTYTHFLPPADEESAQHAAHDLSALTALHSLSVTHRLPRGLSALQQLTRLEVQSVDLSRGEGQV